MGRFFQTADPKYRDFSFEMPKEDMYLALEQEMKAKSMEAYTRDMANRLNLKTFSHFSGDLNDAVSEIDNSINSLVDAYKKGDPEADIMLRELRDKTKADFSNSGQIGVLIGKYNEYNAALSGFRSNKDIAKEDINLWSSKYTNDISKMSEYEELQNTNFREIPKYYDVNEKLKKYIDSDKFKQTFESYVKTRKVKKKDKNGNVVIGKDGKPVYELQRYTDVDGISPELKKLAGFGGLKYQNMQLTTEQYDILSEQLATQLMLQNDPEFRDYKRFRFDFGDNSMNVYNEDTGEFDSTTFNDFNSYLNESAKQIGQRQSRSHTQTISKKEKVEYIDNKYAELNLKNKHARALEALKLRNAKKLHDYKKKKEEAIKKAKNGNLQGFKINNGLEKYSKFNGLLDNDIFNRKMNSSNEEEKKIYLENLHSILDELRKSNIIDDKKFKELSDGINVPFRSANISSTTLDRFGIPITKYSDKGSDARDYPLEEISVLYERFQEKYMEENIPVASALAVPEGFMPESLKAAMELGPKGGLNKNLLLANGNKIKADHVNVVNLRILPNGKTEYTLKAKEGVYTDKPGFAFSFFKKDQKPFTVVVDTDDSIFEDYFKVENGVRVPNELYYESSQATKDAIDNYRFPAKASLENMMVKNIRKNGNGDAKTRFFTNEPIVIKGDKVSYETNISQGYASISISGEGAKESIYKVLNANRDKIEKSQVPRNVKIAQLDILDGIAELLNNGELTPEEIGLYFNNEANELDESKVILFNDYLNKILASSQL